MNMCYHASRWIGYEIYQEERLAMLLRLCCMLLTCAFLAVASQPLAHAALGEVKLYGIAAGPDGALWFADGARGSIGRISVAGQVREYPLPKHLIPLGIAAGGDGNLWFTTEAPYIFGRITPHGAIILFHIPPPTNLLVGVPYLGIYRQIIAGTDGPLWMIDTSAHFVLRSTTAGLTHNAYVDMAREFTGIIPGQHGAVWLVLSGTPAAIGSDYYGRDAHFYTPGPNFAPLGPIAEGGDGNLWFAEMRTNFIETFGCMTPTGTFTAYAWSTSQRLTALARGSDGAVWGVATPVQPGSDTFLRIDMRGAVTTFPLPPGTVANEIVAGSDGGLWFTDGAHDAIGRISTRGTLVEYALPAS